MSGKAIRKAVVFLVLVSFTAIYLVGAAYGQEETPEAASAMKYLAMAHAVGLSCVGAGYAVGKTGVAASATITEKPELFGRTIVYVGMAEGIAIYGLLIAFLIWIT